MIFVAGEEDIADVADGAVAEDCLATHLLAVFGLPPSCPLFSRSKFFALEPAPDGLDEFFLALQG